MPGEFQSYISFDAASVRTRPTSTAARAFVACFAAPAGGADVRGERDRAMSARACAIAVAAAACAAPVAFAHHSTALVYDRDGALIEAEGVITEVAWVNPHVRFKMRGAGADGVERVWEIESNSVSIVSRFGLTAELVAAGTRVKVAGNGGRQLDNVLWLTNMLLPSGAGDSVRRWRFSRAGRSRRSAATFAAPSRPTRRISAFFASGPT